MPRPEPDAIARWWANEKPRFHPGLRYLGGRELTTSTIIDALWHGPTRRRAALALELDLRTNGVAAVDTHLLSAKQTAQLEQLQRLDPIDFQHGYPM